MILHAASEFVGDKIIDGVRFSADKEEIEKLMWDNPADVRLTREAFRERVRQDIDPFLPRHNPLIASVRAEVY